MMLNTLKQTADNSDTQVEERLAKLAEFDQISAKQLQNSFVPNVELEDPLSWKAWNSGTNSVDTEQKHSSILCGSKSGTRKSALTDVTEKVRQWLSAEEKQPDVVIVPGIGNSNKIEALLALLPEQSKILLIEHDFSRARELFQRCRIEDYIEEGRLRLAFGKDETYIEAQLLPILDMPKCPVIRIFDPADIPSDDSEFYNSILLKIRNNIQTNVANLITVINKGPLWQFNTIKNLPTLISKPGVNLFENLFPGRPAIMVAAGPSLNDALDLLGSVSKKFVVISTGTALSALRKAGIKPDLVVLVDARRITSAQFETRCDDLYLACSSIVSPPIPSKFKGVFSGYINVNPIGKWVTSFNEPKGVIFAGGTVSATAIDLAAKMGCNPIISVGLDLSAAEDGTSHADNTMYHGHHNKAKELIPVPGNYRETVQTVSQFRVYIEIISSYVEHYKNIRFINATNAGARINGMELIPIAGLSSFAGESFDAFEKIQKLYESYTPSDTKNACIEIKKIITQMEDVKNDAVKAAMICNELIMTLRSPCLGDENPVREKLDTLKEIDDKIMETKESSLVLDMSLRPIYYAMGTNPEQHEERHSDAVVANKRSRKLYEQIAGAATWTRGLLSEALAQIEGKA